MEETITATKFTQKIWKVNINTYFGVLKLPELLMEHDVVESIGCLFNTLP